MAHTQPFCDFREASADFAFCLCSPTFMGNIASEKSRDYAILGQEGVWGGMGYSVQMEVAGNTGPSWQMRL